MVYTEVEHTPIGEMHDLISCYQLIHGMADPAGPADDEEMIPEYL